MTGTEMQQAFQATLARYGRRTSIDSSDIFHFINLGQEEFIRERFRLFERTQEVADDVQTLVVDTGQENTEYAGEALVNYYMDDLDLPSEYLYFVSARVITLLTADPTGTPVGTQRPGTGLAELGIGRLARHDDVLRMLADPFNTTYRTQPLVAVRGGKLKVYTDSTFVATKVEMTYMKKQSLVSRTVPSDLPDITHRELVQRGVAIFLNSRQEVSQTQPEVQELT